MAVSRVTIKLKGAGFKKLLMSGDVAKDLEARGRKIENALPTGAGEEWRLDSFKGGDRHQVIVRTDNTEARRASAEDMALLRALGAGA